MLIELIFSTIISFCGIHDQKCFDNHVDFIINKCDIRNASESELKKCIIKVIK